VRVAVPTHHSREGRPSDRGLRFGRAQAPAVANTVAVYRRMFEVDRGLAPAEISGLGREAEARIRSFRPELAEEIEAVADGAAQSREVLFAVNARTELLAGGQVAGTAPGECSTVAVLDDHAGTGVLAQNWDFHPDLAGSRVVWTIEGPDGRRCTTFTEAGIVGKIGVNSDGLALAINFLATEVDGGLDGVPVHVLCRTLLGEARSVDDARSLIAQAPLSASVCLVVAGPSAGGVTARAFECWPGGVAEIGPEPGRSWLAHTNHFLGAVGARDTLFAGPSRQSTCERLDRLVAVLRHTRGQDARDLTALLQTTPVFQIDDEDVPWIVRCATLATVAFEVPSGRMSLSCR
jgi:isopenicillin-N N-acyltransferase like protein